jgi:hypothetical protein
MTALAVGARPRKIPRVHDYFPVMRCLAGVVSFISAANQAKTAPWLLASDVPSICIEVDRPQRRFVMKSLIGLVLGLVVASIGIGVIGLQPAALVWAGQATEHDHTHGADAPATPAVSQPVAPPDGLQMSQMRQDMMARMSVLDDRINALGIEMNAAKTTDEKLAAVTKLLNVFIEQRSMMRMEMDTQGKMMEQMMLMHKMMSGGSKPAH